MKNMKIVATVLLGILLVSASVAQETPAPQELQMYKRAGRNKEHKQETGRERGSKDDGAKWAKLNLTPEQQAALQQLRTAHQKQMLELKNQRRELNARLISLQTADKPDTKAMDLCIEQMGQVQIQMQKTRNSHVQQVRGTLTDDQRVAFDVKMVEKRGRRG